METQIYTTRKLEKIVSEFISKEKSIDQIFLGKWTASIFYINRIKCWILINRITKYLLELSDMKNSDLTNISTVFKEAFYSQLVYDGIIIDDKLIEKIVGKIVLNETDNDRSSNGSLNNYLLYFNEWKYEFKYFDNMPFRDLTNRLNSQPIEKLNGALPKEKMQELLESYSKD